MRLVRIGWEGELSLVIHLRGQIPPYAFLSHTWGIREVTWKELGNGTAKSMPGYAKLEFAATQATKDGLQFFWIDTCCVDRSSSAELSEAINSMFTWCQGAEKCYVYLSDVSLKDPDTGVIASSRQEIEFRGSRWFTRSWTLSELLAPVSVEFFSSEGSRIGDKYSLSKVIHEITGIPIRAIEGAALSEFSVDERLSWASRRTATREEDVAYSSFGIFGVSMPIIYGEGRNAFIRLRREIDERSRHDKPSQDSTRSPEQKHQDEKKHPTNSPPGLDRQSRTYGKRPRQRDSDSESDSQNEGDTNDPPHPSYYRSLIGDEFRVLILDPGEMGSTITGQIETFNLGEPLMYHALSYVWGQEPPVQQILVNGKTTFIRPNLFFALQRIRALQSVQMRIWIDSLCINQSDDLERNGQVLRMAQIYNKADGVFVWLGEENLTSRLAIELVDEIYEQKMQWTGSWWQKPGFAALGELLERPWFRRGWVIQEAAFSTNSIIQCGDRQVYMDHFGMAVDSIRARISTEPVGLGFMDSRQRTGLLANFVDSPATRMLDMIEGAFAKSDEGDIVNHMMTLEMLVHLGTFSETSNERDAIYSLLNVAKDTAASYQSDREHTILPDYRKDIIDVYVDFVLHCCLHSESIDILVRPWAPAPSSLIQVQGRDDEHGQISLSLPSWIPSRSKLPYGDPALRSKQRLHGNPLVGISQKRNYNAHNGLKPSLSAVKGSNTTLRVKGAHLAQITETSARLVGAVVTRECLSILGTISRKPHSGHINLPDSIWRTLCANRDDRGDPAPRSYRVAMLDLLQNHSRSTAATTSTNLLEHMTSIDIEELLETDIDEHVKNYLMVVRDVIWNRRTFRAAIAVSSDIVGLVPQSARVGDSICILYGCSVPVVLRKHQDPHTETYWQLIGDAYAHAFMDGDLFRQTQEEIEAMEVDFDLR